MIHRIGCGRTDSAHHRRTGRREGTPAKRLSRQVLRPYTIACALFGGGGLGLALNDFRELDETRLTLAGKVTCFADERATELFPHSFAAVLRVRCWNTGRTPRAVARSTR